MREENLAKLISRGYPMFAFAPNLNINGDEDMVKSNKKKQPQYAEDFLKVDDNGSIFHKVANDPKLLESAITKFLDAEWQEEQKDPNKVDILAKVLSLPAENKGGKDVLAIAIESGFDLEQIGYILGFISRIPNYPLRFSYELWQKLEKPEMKPIAELLNKQLDLEEFSLIRLQKILIQTEVQIPLEEKEFHEVIGKAYEKMANSSKKSEAITAWHQNKDEKLIIESQELPSIKAIIDEYLSASDKLLETLFSYWYFIEDDSIRDIKDKHELIQQKFVDITAIKYSSLMKIIEDRFTHIPEGFKVNDINYRLLQTIRMDYEDLQFIREFEEFRKFYTETQNEELDLTFAPNHNIEYVKGIVASDDIESTKQVLDIALERYKQWHYLMRYAQYLQESGLEAGYVDEIYTEEKVKGCLDAALLEFHPEELYEFARVLRLNNLIEFDVYERLKDEQLQGQLITLIMGQFLNLLTGDRRLSAEANVRDNECKEYEFKDRLDDSITKALEISDKTKARNYLLGNTVDTNEPFQISDDSDDYLQDVDDMKEPLLVDKDPNTGKSFAYRQGERFVHKLGFGTPVTGNKDKDPDSDKDKQSGSGSMFGLWG